MNQETRKELSTLLSATVDGRISDEGIKRLNHLLKNDTQAQAYYLQYISVHAHLESSHSNSTPIHSLNQNPAQKPNNKTKYYIAAAACLAIFCGLWFSIQNTPAPQPPNNSLEQSTGTNTKIHQSTKILAIIGSAEDAEWDIQNIKPAQGTPLGEGSVTLHTGRIRLDFPAGEKITLAAPAIFNIKGTSLLSLQLGELIASVPEAGRGFTVITPNGAVVDLGTEFAIEVSEDGKNYVKVLTGAVVASSTNTQGNTTWEKTLHSGEEVSIQQEMPIKNETTQRQYINHLPSVIPPLCLSPKYRESVKKSHPISYWEFDSMNTNGTITDTMGINPMHLGMSATIKTHDSGGYLHLNRKEHRGFAKPDKSIAGLNTESGCSVEMWAYSDHVDWQTLISISSIGPLPPDHPKDVNHTPQIILTERAGHFGSSRYHIHPDFALRSVYRSPASYRGGTNIYTENSHLIHQWYHIVIVRNQEHFRTYINGKLTAEERIHFKPDKNHYKLLLGRLHSSPNIKDPRQWSGAIDEVSLYDRALEPSEVIEHYKASSHAAE